MRSGSTSEEQIAILLATVSARSPERGVFHVTARREERGLRDAGAGVVWLMAWPTHRILDMGPTARDVCVDAFSRPEDGLSAHLANSLRAWAWAMLGACLVVPAIVAVNLWRSPLTTG